MTLFLQIHTYICTHVYTRTHVHVHTAYAAAGADALVLSCGLVSANGFYMLRGAVPLEKLAMAMPSAVKVRRERGREREREGEIQRDRARACWPLHLSHPEVCWCCICANQT